MTLLCATTVERGLGGSKLRFVDFTRLFEQLRGKYLSEKRKNVKFPIKTVRKVFLVDAYSRSYRTLKLTTSLNDGVTPGRERTGPRDYAAYVRSASRSRVRTLLRIVLLARFSRFSPRNCRRRQKSTSVNVKERKISYRILF